MKGKKILVIIGGSYVSGLEIVTLHLIHELKKSGNEVRCIVSGWNDGVFIGKLKEIDIPFDEVKIGWLYLTRPYWTMDTLVNLPRAFFACRKILKSFNPDICHFCGYSAVVMLYPILKNRHCVYNLQEPHAPTPKHLFIYKLLNRRIAVFTAVSNHIVKVLLDLGIPSEKIKLIYNGVPAIPDLPPAEKREGPLVFGIIGQVVPWKGHENLVDAIGLLKKSYEGKLMVHIFGNDKIDYAKTVKGKIKDKNLTNYFIWRGFIKNQASIYAEVDVVVVPSLSEEPCSLTILESMMRGKLVLASERGGNTELIDDGESGLIFKAENPASLSDCIESVFKNRNHAAVMAMCAHRKALRNFTSVNMEEGYDKIYSEIIPH